MIKALSHAVAKAREAAERAKALADGPDQAKTPAKRPDGLKKPDKFFSTVRGSFGSLKQSQVEGYNAVLKACADVDWPAPWTAYALATAYHETAFTMQPIKEYGGRAYFMRMYDKTGKRPHVARNLGNTEVGDGAKYAGRGYVQLTGRRNYRVMSEHTGVDLVTNPDKAKDPAIAAQIMIVGMALGLFTGKKMRHYLPMESEASFEDFKQARRIINGRDKWVKIAREAQKFQAALVAGEWRA